MKINLCDFILKYHIYPLLLLFTWKKYVEIFTSFCYRIIRPDEWEIFPAEVKMDDNIGSGAFGTVFCGHISRDVCKKLPYFKLYSKKLGRKGEMNQVAVKRLKGECSIFYSFISSVIVFQWFCKCSCTLKLRKTLAFSQNIFNKSKYTAPSMKKDKKGNKYHTNLSNCFAFCKSYALKKSQIVFIRVQMQKLTSYKLFINVYSMLLGSKNHWVVL